MGILWLGISIGFRAIKFLNVSLTLASPLTFSIVRTFYNQYKRTCSSASLPWASWNKERRAFKLLTCIVTNNGEDLPPGTHTLQRLQYWFLPKPLVDVNRLAFSSWIKNQPCFLLRKECLQGTWDTSLKKEVSKHTEINLLVFEQIYFSVKQTFCLPQPFLSPFYFGQHGEIDPHGYFFI